MTGLTEGLTYKFRVKAVNAAGESEPAYVPDPVEVKDRLGEFSKSQISLPKEIFFFLIF